MGRRRWRRAAAGLVIAVATTGTASGDVIDVGPGESIQAAIEMAMDGDEIIVAPGFYFENIDFLGKPITLRSSHGASATFLGQRSADSVVKCVSGEGPDTVLGGKGPADENWGFTIWLGAALDGGGMLNIDSSPTVINCEFRSNQALNSGGGMSNRTCDPVLCGSRETAAQVMSTGSSPTVMDCMFIQNSAAVG
ncbi:MAG: hypothetical protein ACYTGP_10740, partial [Planctomycetota bacterium]